MILFLALFLAVSLPSPADDEALLRAAIFLSGASDAEQLDESILEQLSLCRSSPLKLNRLNAARLASTGILTTYQAASIVDYRSCSGDILSWEELALLDGFSEETVEVLKPFLSLESRNPPGAVADSVYRVKQELLLRVTEKNAGAKYRLGSQDFSLALARRYSAGGGSGSGHIKAAFGAHEFVLGAYNLRFGQGVSHWSAFRLSGLSTLNAFLQHGSALSPVQSFAPSGAHQGLAWQYSTLHFQGLVSASLPGFAAVRGMYRFRSGEVGASALWDSGRPVFSLEGRLGLPRAEMCWEASLTPWTAAGNLSAILKPGERFRLAFQGRVLPSRFTGKKNGEYALASGAEYRFSRTNFLSFTADAALLPVPLSEPRRRQFRSYALWQCAPGEENTLKLRFDTKIPSWSPPRLEFRADFLRDGPAPLALRADAVRCDGWGFLSYAEFGRRDPSFSAYFRITAFSTDGWNSRIWSYERDVPGSFSVPAYNGHGFAFTLYGSVKYTIRKWTFKACVRSGVQIKKEKPAQASLHFQTVLQR